MKILRSFTAASLAGAALYLGSSTSAVAQFNQRGRPDWGQGRNAPVAMRAAALQLANPGMDSFGVSRLAGQPLRSSNQEELGVVADFLVDPQTGKVRFVVVPSGRGASGETFRLVPVDAIDPASPPDALIVRVNRDRWQQVGTMTEQELPRQVALSAEQQKRAVEQFGLNATAASSMATAELVRASQLKGQSIRSGNDTLGTIADVLIDVRQQVAAAVLAPAANFGGAGQTYILPFEKLKFSGDAQNTITTDFGRQDFPAIAANAASANAYPSGPFGQAFSAGNNPVNAAASAVQQMLARDQGAAGVQVVPESRLVLRGSVPDEQKKVELERAAQQAAPGMRIDNEIVVRRW